MAEPKTGKDALRRFARVSAPVDYDTFKGQPAGSPGAGNEYSDDADEKAGYTQGPRKVDKDPAKVGGGDA